MSDKEKKECEILLKYLSYFHFERRKTIIEDLKKTDATVEEINYFLDKVENGETEIEFFNKIWSWKQGRLFESFMVEFLYEDFDLTGWSCDKFVNDDKVNKSKYGSTIHYPDLMLQYKRSPWFNFAIECKWRKETMSVECNQFKNYYNFQKQKKMPVFIVFGVGKNGTCPETLYILPMPQTNKTYNKFINSHDAINNKYYEINESECKKFDVAQTQIKKKRKQVLCQFVKILNEYAQGK